MKTTHTADLGDAQSVPVRRRQTGDQTENGENMKELKGELIADACAKPVRLLIQYDGWPQHEADGLIESDGDGHCLFEKLTWELRRTDIPVRVCINPQRTSKAEVLELLKKIRRWVKRDWERHRRAASEDERLNQPDSDPSF